jgi:ABC-type multidrug transport system fused ATPase/permease subunit
VLILAGAAIVLSPLVTSILLLGGGLLLIALRPFSRRVRQLSATVARLDVDLGNRLDETVRVARDIKLFGGTDEFTKSAHRTTNRSAQADRRRHIYVKTVPIIFQTVGLLLLLVALIVASSATGVSLVAMGGAALLLLRGLSYGQQLSSVQ